MSDVRILVFSGSSRTHLTESIAKQIEQEVGQECLGKAELVSFRSGQFKWVLPDSVRGAECWVIQFFDRQHSDDLVKQFMEAKLLLRTLADCHAASWSLVMPLLPDTRQDQQWHREPYTLALYATELLHLGVKELITYDLHQPATAGLFGGLCTHLYSSYVFLPELRKTFKSFDVVASTDTGSAKTAEWYSRRLGCEAAIMYKGAKRERQGRQTTSHRLAGDVKDKKVLVVDELCDSGGTLVGGVNFLIDEKGARQVVIAIPHTVGADECQLELAALCQRPEVLAYWTTPAR